MKATHHRSSSIPQLARVVFVRLRRRRPRLACMQRTLSRKALLAACLGALAGIGCGDDGGGGGADSGRYTPLASVARSDGTPGGDLAALQYRMIEAQCKCAEELAEFCVDVIWEDGGLECTRNAYNEHIETDQTGMACLAEVTKAAIDCLERVPCDSASGIDRCYAAYRADVTACPPASEELAQELLMCPGPAGSWL